MARIRTIKPQFFRHVELYKAERETGLPLRVAFAGLWTACDREGRFRWQPEELKLDCLPYDAVDFTAVLEALMKRGFIEFYEVGERGFGYVPSFPKHQHVNVREAQSDIPAPAEAGARTCTPVHARGEGKGKEGEGEVKALASQVPSQAPALNGPLDIKRALFTQGLSYLQRSGLTEPHARSMLGKWRRDYGDYQTLLALASAEGGAASEPLAYVQAVLIGKEKPHVVSTHPLGAFAELVERERAARGEDRPAAHR